MKPAVIKSRFEFATWMVVTRNGVDLFDTWQEALHWATICARLDAGNTIRRRLRTLLEAIQ